MIEMNDKAREAARFLAARCSQPGGGFTYRISDGTEASGGYAVSIYPEFEERLEFEGVTAFALSGYIYDHLDLLSRPNHYLGAWHNPEDGLVYLDVTVVVATPEAAADLCRQFNQQAYYDFAAGQSVYVNAPAQ